ncbi:histidine phosphatase family protein [Arthrobacter russicus]|jgi:broad specificity phosphatase PhoE|uniref:Broad specificity phosphatase PhoE n=1 Tax=Arthrobacter russicus TaxID=172040 RepID=A0ABU1JFN7_9MICC|nr:histidine phosphatase family protein [Arthrobacter russicus]MDR6270197.1 broad specificity phosphatase PhoE [Arthrobacter russicus]
MPSATVHLLRHGEVFNPEGVLYGRLPNFHLSDRGVAMAVLAAEYFQSLAGRGAVFAVLRASPLTRAQETAQPTASALGLAIGTDQRLIEAGNDFEGLKMSPAELLKPIHWPKLVNPFRPSWGESYRAQVDRMRLAVDDARRAAVERAGDGAQAILVSHQLPIWVSRLSAERRRLFHDPRRRDCSLASVTSLEFDGERLSGVGYHEPAAGLLPGATATAGA